MEKLIILGTGHAMTLDCYNTCFTLQNNEGKNITWLKCYIVDSCLKVVSKKLTKIFEYRNIVSIHFK